MCYTEIQNVTTQTQSCPTVLKIYTVLCECYYSTTLPLTPGLYIIALFQVRQLQALIIASHCRNMQARFDL